MSEPNPDEGGMDALQKLLARSEIRAVLDRYGMLARDAARWDEIAKCFAPDAVFRLPNGTELSPDRIEEVVQGEEAKYIRHHVTTADIKFVGLTEARVETNFIAITEVASPDHWGCWKDVFQKQKDGAWKIQDRSVIVDGGAGDGWYMRKYGEYHKAPEHGDIYSL